MRVRGVYVLSLVFSGGGHVRCRRWGGEGRQQVLLPVRPGRRGGQKTAGGEKGGTCTALAPLAPLALAAAGAAAAAGVT